MAKKKNKDDLTRITITQFRTDLEKYLDRTEKGESFLITRYGKPCVILLPVGRYEKMQNSGKETIVLQEKRSKK